MKLPKHNLNGGEALGVRKLACAFAREASFACLKRQQAAALQGYFLTGEIFLPAVIYRSHRFRQRQS